MEILYKEYKEKDNKDFKVQLYYNLGGTNYYSGREEKRGYYIGVTPVHLEDNGHYIIETSVAWTGIKDCILEVKRKSSKAEKQAMDLMTDEFIDSYINHVIRMNKKVA